MNLYQLDLSALLILRKLLDEKHVSNTALSLNMSQSTVSRALQKMRAFFEDELLVRTHHGFELTSKAEQIKQDLTPVITSLEKLINKQSFNPASNTGKVRFYGLQPQIETLLPKVIAQVRQKAPNMVISIDTIPKRHFDELIKGNVHFALSSHEPSISEQNIYRTIVAKRDFRLLMSKDHPLAEEQPTIDQLSQYSFGQVSLQGEKTLSIEKKYSFSMLKAKGAHLNVPLQLTNFNSAPSIAAETDIIFHLPTPFAQAACKDERLITKKVPAELQLDFEYVYLYWHKHFHDDPMCKWIRNIFKELYEGKKINA